MTSKKSDPSKRSEKKSPCSTEGLSANPRRSVLLLLLFLLSLNFLVYSPLVNNDFVNFDDNSLITEHILITSSGETFDLGKVMDRHLGTPHYKPLVYLTWIGLYRLFGPEPLVFHGINFLLHAISALLVFFIFSEISRFQEKTKPFATEIGFAVAALFSVHPLHVESVAWASELKDCLCGFFFLSALSAYLFHLRRSRGFSALAVSVLCSLGAILSKLPGSTLLAVLVLVLWISDRLRSPKRTVELGPFFLLFLVSLFLYGFLPGLNEASAPSETVFQPRNDIDGESEITRDLPRVLELPLLANLRAWSFVGHLLVPVKLSIVYPQRFFVDRVGVLIFLLPLLSIAVGFALWKLRKTAPWFVFGALFFVFNIGPALGVPGTGTNFLSDRYTYLAALGLYFTLAAGATFLGRKRTDSGKTPRRWILVGVLSTLSVLAWQRVTVWENSETLWTDVIEKYPRKIWISYNNRGNHYQATGRLDLALKDLDLVVKLKPTALTLSNRGATYRNLGRHEEALTDFNRSIELDPDYYKSFINRGNVLLDLNRNEEALKDFNRALDLRPRSIDALNNRGMTKARLGDPAAGIADMTRALEIDPYSTNVYRSRGILSAQTNRHDQAVRDFEEYLSLSPADHAILNARAVSHQYLGDHRLALVDLDAAIEIDGNQGTYWLNRAYSHLALGEKAKSMENARVAQKLGQQPTEEYWTLVRE